MEPTQRFLFGSDLDGTLLPNTGTPARSGCLERTHALLATLMDRGCPVCYVSGRHLSLARLGQSTFRLPLPSYWVCNVGTEIYDAYGVPEADWSRRLGPEFDIHALREVVRGIPLLTVQERERQGAHKFSLYYPGALPTAIPEEILEQAGQLYDQIKLIVSFEESTGRALLDVVPESAGKAAAFLYLAEREGFDPAQVFFSGDSGNDLDALLSGVRATLVGNAPPAVRDVLLASQTSTPQANVYVAAETYGDGIIEGLLHHGLLLSDCPEL